MNIDNNEILWIRVLAAVWIVLTLGAPSVEIGNPLEPLQLPPQILQRIQTQITISNSHKHIEASKKKIDAKLDKYKSSSKSKLFGHMYSYHCKMKAQLALSRTHTEDEVMNEVSIQPFPILSK